jgi:hypothetical protein
MNRPKKSSAFAIRRNERDHKWQNSGVSNTSTSRNETITKRMFDGDENSDSEVTPFRSSIPATASPPGRL